MHSFLFTLSRLGLLHAYRQFDEGHDDCCLKIEKKSCLNKLSFDQGIMLKLYDIKMCK